MLCPNCGKNIEDGSRYCTHCAERLPYAEPKQPVALDTPLSAPSATDTAERVSAKVARKIVYFVGAFFAIVIVVLMKGSLVLKLALLVMLVPFLYLLHLFIHGGMFFVAWIFSKIRGR